MTGAVRKPITIVKLGGSLLTLPDLRDRLRQLLQELQDALPLLIVGGGAAADLVREWDALHQLGDVAAHWCGIRAMGFNAQLVATLLRDAEFVSSREQAEQSWSLNRIPILDCETFIRSQQTRLPLPHHWDVTSDSIAGWVAICWPAESLMFVKSTDFQSADLHAAHQLGVVDAHLPTWATILPHLQWVNLRHSPLRIHLLTPADHEAR